MNCSFNNWEDLMELMECHVYIYIKTPTFLS